MWGVAQSLLSGLGQTDFDILWDVPEFPDVDSGGLDGINPENPPPPSLNDIIFGEVDFGHTPPDPITDEIAHRDPPEPNYTDPGFNIPSPPSVVWPTGPSDPPGITDISIPEAPTITLPAVPSLGGVVIPSPPEYNIPEFEWELPTENLDPPEPMFAWNEAEYNSEIKERLQTEIYNNLVNGGSGLSNATEQAIYDRAVSRMTDEEQLAMDQMLDFFAGRGFDLPPGALSGQMLEMNNKVLARREDLNNDILIQQSKLAQVNTHFIIDKAIALEKNLMDYTNQFQTRAFEAAKFLVQSAVIIFQVKVESYKAKLDVYRSQAEVYKARIQGEIAKAEFYRVQIEGVKASVMVQGLLVEAYKAQVEASNALIQLYVAEMEGARINASINEIRIKSYAAEVQAYSAKVAAVSERYRGYQAQIAGEVSKAEMYKAQVEGYGARVEAYKAQVQADAIVLEQHIGVNRDATEVFKALVQKYMADVEAASKKAEIEAKNEGLKIESYKVEGTKYGIQLDAAAKSYIGAIEELKAKADVEIKAAELEIKSIIGKQDIIQGSLRAATQVASQMGAAAIAGVNASVSLQHGESRSDSTSNSYSGSLMLQGIDQLSVITSHMYTHNS